MQIPRFRVQRCRRRLVLSPFTSLRDSHPQLTIRSYILGKSSGPALFIACSAISTGESFPTSLRVEITTTADPLDIAYRYHERVRTLIDVIRFCAADISLSFERWGEPYVTGPGLYFAIVSGHTVRDHADPMGDNRWPASTSRDVLVDVDSFYEATTEVARSRDGAVVVSVDGIVQEQMVRFRDHPPDSEGSPDSPRYADWMGSRHMSALDASARPEVVTTVTLSAETGRVTVFEDGEYGTTPRAKLSQKWME